MSMQNNILIQTVPKNSILKNGITTDIIIMDNN